MVSVLGISPGTRTIGLAVFSDNLLIHWQVKTLTGPWSDRKLNSILTALTRILDRYYVSEIVCKTIPPPRESENLDIIITAIGKLAVEKGIRFVPCSLEDILTVVVPSGKRPTKEMLADSLALRYSELSREFTKERINRHPYYMKLFEAIAAVEFQKRK